MRIGIHTTREGSLVSTALKAHELAANTFQIFSSSPRMWRGSILKESDVREFRDACERFDLRPLAVHGNYLINLASTDRAVRSKSIAAFRGELDRAQIVEADYLVAHPGSCCGQSSEEGVARVVDGLSEAGRGFRSKKLMVLLEGTAGSGTSIGSKFEELREIRDGASRLIDIEIGYCLDTCHLLAAGYDISTPAGLRETVRHADEALGLDRVHVIHVNDSKGRLGSRVDRHANIGEGHIGKEAFRRILAHPKLRSKAFILETPVDEEGDDRRNIEILKSLCPRSRTTTTRSN